MTQLIIMVIITIILNTLFFGGLIYLFILLVKALRKYLNSEPQRREEAILRKSLGEVLKEHRTRCAMTQEFVAEAMGVSRQAVSKWENGTADPSTSNLLKLAQLYGVTAEELIRSVRAGEE